MARHAAVVWTGTDQPWRLEESLIGSLVLPLNLDRNRRSPFHDTLSALRAAHRFQARSQPIKLATVRDRGPEQRARKR
jgi:hypothetical protein